MRVRHWPQLAWDTWTHLISSETDAAYMSILAAGSKIALLADSLSNAELSTIWMEQSVGVSGIRGKGSSWDASHCG